MRDATSPGPGFGGPAVRATPAQRRAVNAMLATTVLVMGNVVFVTPVLAEVAIELQATQTEIQMVGDVLPVTLAALLLPAGSLLDRYGRRRGVLLGLAVMALSLVGSAFAQSPGSLIGTRCLAGVGAALAFPGTLSTITAVLPAELRDRGVAIWSGACMVGGVFALSFAGAVAELADMRALFWAMAMVTAACWGLVAVSMPETKVDGQPAPDTVGSVAAVLGVGGLAYGITVAPQEGLTEPRVLACLALGVLGLVTFVGRCLSASHPLLDVRIFRLPLVTLGVIAIFVPFVCSQAWFFLGFQYNSYVFGWSPLGSALGIAPAALTIVPFAIAGPALALRFGVVKVLVSTLAIDAVASAALGLAGLSQNFLVVAGATMLWGVGIGLAQAPATQLILEALPARAQGVASALNDLSRELAAATGIALLGSAFNTAYRMSVDSDDRIPADAAVADSPVHGIAAAEASGDGAMLDAVHRAVAQGWMVSFLVAAVAILVVVALLLAVYAKLAPASTGPTTATSGSRGRLH